MADEPFDRQVLMSLSEFEVSDNIHRRSDVVGTFAYHVCDHDVKDTMESLMMAVIRAVHDSCPDAKSRYDAIRALKIKTESLFLQYEDAMQNDEKDPFISFAADLGPEVRMLIESGDIR